MRQLFTIRRLICLLCVGLFCISCEKAVDTPSINGSTTYKTHKIAVVMPSSNQERWERSANWQAEVMKASQAAVGGGVTLSIEWIDEDMDGLDTELKRLANDDAIEAIIGPYYSENAITMASECYSAQKCLILPTASSTELHRLYSGRNFMWILSESDFSQCEVLLLEAKKHGATEVSLICCDDYYGHSYCDWFGFQAVEMNMKVNRVYEYTNDAELSQSIEEFAAAYTTVADGTIPYLVFAPSRESDVLIFDQLRENHIAEGGDFPLTLCSDIAYSEIVRSSVKGNYEGTA